MIKPSQKDSLEAQDRAREAESLLGHRIFGEAVINMRRSIVERWLALPIGDPKLLELHMKAKVLDELVGELRSFVTEIKIRRQSDEVA